MVDLALVSLVTHQQLQHSKSSSRAALAAPPKYISSTYCISFPRIDQDISFPVEGCQGIPMNQTNLSIHFVQFHVSDTIFILDEVKFPYS